MSSRQTQTQAIHTQTNKTHKYTNISPLFIVKPCFLTHPTIHIIFNYKLTKNGLKKIPKKTQRIKNNKSTCVTVYPANQVIIIIITQYSI